MKKIFALIVLLLPAGALLAQSDTVDLRSHGKLTLYLADGWKLSQSDFGDRTLVTIEPKDEAVNAGCTLTVTYPEQDRLSTKAKLRTEVETASAQFVEGSVEGKAVAKELSLRAGYGFYCNFTDPDLIGKPPQKGNYKTISVGLIHLAPDILVELSISADGFRSEPYQQLLGAVEGMEHEAGRAPRSKDTVQRGEVRPPAGAVARLPQAPIASR